MMQTFADPKSDFVFKRIFGAESRKGLLIALLNDLLELDGDGRIVEVQHLPPEQHPVVTEMKFSIVDVKCKDAGGRRFVVEMQVLNVEGFEKRIVYNASKAYVMQLREGQAYRELCDVVAVTICDFMLWTDRGASGAYKVPMLSHWRMQEKHGGELGLGHVRYVFLELPKYAAGAAPLSLVDKWAYFFNEAARADTVPAPLKDGPFADALEVTRVAGFAQWEYEAYEREEMAERDARGRLAFAVAQGRAAGEAKGRAEGEAKGRAEGEAKGRADGEAKGRADGEAKGRAEGVRSMLLLAFAERGWTLTEQQAVRVQECDDFDRLTEWFRRTMGARAVDDVLV